MVGSTRIILFLEHADGAQVHSSVQGGVVVPIICITRSPALGN